MACRWLPGKLVAGLWPLHGGGVGDPAAGAWIHRPWLPDWVTDELQALTRGGGERRPASAPGAKDGVRSAPG